VKEVVWRGRRSIHGNFPNIVSLEAVFGSKKNNNKTSSNKGESLV